MKQYIKIPRERIFLQIPGVQKIENQTGIEIEGINFTKGMNNKIAKHNLKNKT